MIPLKTFQNLSKDKQERITRTVVEDLQKHPVVYRFYIKTLFADEIPFRNEILLSLREYSLKYLRSLLENARERGEIRPGLDIDKAGFVLDAIMDRFLQARTIQHLDAGLGIYNCTEDEAHNWIRELTEILRMGIGVCG